jgi:hypothetical protein
LSYSSLLAAVVPCILRPCSSSYLMSLVSIPEFAGWCFPIARLSSVPASPHLDSIPRVLSCRIPRCRPPSFPASFALNCRRIPCLLFLSRWLPAGAPSLLDRHQSQHPPSPSDWIHRVRSCRVPRCSAAVGPCILRPRSSSDWMSLKFIPR